MSPELVQLILVLALFCLLRVALGKSKKERPRLFQTLRYIAVGSLVVFMIATYAASHGYYIQGYRSHSLLFLFAALAAIVYALVDRLSLTPTRFVFFAHACFMLVCSYALVLEMIADYHLHFFYSDKHFRIEDDSGLHIMHPRQPPALFVKHGLYERKFRMNDFGGGKWTNKADLEKLYIRQISHNEVLVHYYLHKGSNSAIRNACDSFVMRYTFN